MTTVTHQRRAIFQRTEHAELVISTLARYREKGEFLLHAFVVMPDHLHVILTPKETIERAAQLIKGGLSFQIRKVYPGMSGSRDITSIEFGMRTTLTSKGYTSRITPRIRTTGIIRMFTQIIRR